MPCKFAKPALPSRPCNPFHKPRELPRQPGTVSRALFCYIFFGFSSTTHVINRASFYKKWDCPSSSWKHPWLTALLTGKPCAALQHIEIFFSPATFSLLLALQTLFRMLPVCCIQIKDQITQILHQVNILQILLWAERGTHLMCKTNNWPELSCSQSWDLWYPVPILWIFHSNPMPVVLYAAFYLRATDNSFYT